MGYLQRASIREVNRDSHDFVGSVMGVRVKNIFDKGLQTADEGFRSAVLIVVLEGFSTGSGQ